MNINEIKIGSVIESHYCLVFFGNKNSDLESIKSTFPHLTFHFVKQTHGDVVVEASDTLLEADAHWTNLKNHALCIQTADCIPLMLYCHSLKQVAAVHAGWRGVENQIARKSVKKFSADSISALIGPHIQFESFEVENDVRNRILGTIRNREGAYKEIDHEKSLVDLNLVLRTQLIEEGVFAENIFVQRIDTKKDLNYHSYRRDRSAGRQISFVALK